MNDGDGKKKLRVVGQSDVFTQQAPRPDAEIIVLSPGMYEVPQDSLMNINTLRCI